MATEPIQVRATVVGVRDTLRALRQIDPVAAKELRRELTAAARLIAAAARKKVPGERPLSGWRNVWAMRGRVRGGQGWPAWYSSEIRSAIKVSTAQTDRAKSTKARTTVAVYSQNPSAIIYEFAKSNHTPNRFSAHLKSYMGGRIMWAGNDEVANQVHNKIMDALGKANGIVQDYVDSAKV